MFQQGPFGTSELAGVGLAGTGGWGRGDVHRERGTASPTLPTPNILAPLLLEFVLPSKVCEGLRGASGGPRPSWVGPIWQALPEAPWSGPGLRWLCVGRGQAVFPGRSQQREAAVSGSATFIINHIY